MAALLISAKAKQMLYDICANSSSELDVGFYGAACAFTANVLPRVGSGIDTCALCKDVNQQPYSAHFCQDVCLTCMPTHCTWG